MEELTEKEFWGDDKNWFSKHWHFVVISILIILVLVLILGRGDSSISGESVIENNAEGENNFVEGNEEMQETSNEDDTSEESVEEIQEKNTKEECVPDWECTSWSECSESGKQTRNCADNNDCATNSGKPEISQSCDYMVEEPDPITITGSGQQASEYFELEKGVSIFELSSSGSGHFSMILYDSEGDYIDLLVNEIGSFDGSKLVSIESKGEYLLDISADENWEVHITQPRNIKANEAPLALSGSGQQASDFFYLEKGMKRFSISHEGSGHFSMILYDSEGDYIDLLVNEIGSFDGSKAVPLSESGNYILDVSADGNWEAKIE